MKRLTLILLFASSYMMAQTVQETKNTIKIDNVTFIKNSTSFNNVFTLKDKHVNQVVNFGIYNHAFKVIKQYNNKAIVLIVNGSYNEAKEVQKYIKENNQIKIEFIKK
jgi:hypothetical protein